MLWWGILNDGRCRPSRMGRGPSLTLWQIARGLFDGRRRGDTCADEVISIAGEDIIMREIDSRSDRDGRSTA